MSTHSPLSWLYEGWADQVGSSVAIMTGQPCAVYQTEEPAEEPGADGEMYWRQPYDAGPGAELWLAASASVWRHVGALVMNPAGVAGSEPSDARSAFLDVLEQSFTQMCSVLGSRLDRVIDIQPGGPVEHLPESCDMQALHVDVSGVLVGPVWIGCNSALREALGVPSNSAIARTTQPEKQSNSKTMDLLMEVELPVGVSFGRAQMRLKDAIKLTTGSIVELNRSISEPVEIIVNNCVIARGEVVVVEGNYGVRIKHIVSREERLRTLF